jgi:hypothetical protein
MDHVLERTSTIVPVMLEEAVVLPVTFAVIAQLTVEEDASLDLETARLLTQMFPLMDLAVPMKRHAKVVD